MLPYTVLQENERFPAYNGKKFTAYFAILESLQGKIRFDSERELKLEKISEYRRERTQNSSTIVDLFFP